MMIPGGVTHLLSKLGGPHIPTIVSGVKGELQSKNKLGSIDRVLEVTRKDESTRAIR